MAILRLHSEPLQQSWLDAYGHLNEAYYLVPFTNATWKLQEHFGIGVDYFEHTGNALYTVETHIRYLREVRAPADIEVESMIFAMDEKRIWLAHQMMVDGDLRCTAEFMLLHYSTQQNRSTPLPRDARDALQQAIIHTVPDWAGKSLSLAR